MNDYTKGILIGAAIGILIMMEYEKTKKPRNLWQKVLRLFHE